MENTNHDMTRPPEALSRTGTGPVRQMRPIYQNLLPPCNHACPAGEDIQGWLAYARDGRYEAAWRALIANNPMPAVHGRVCYHPCESACNRGFTDQSVSIHAVERFLGDQALHHGWRPEFTAPNSGKKVLIVGSGPAGLSCAWHLRRLGHDVEIREAKSRPGGMLRFGIPAYRMPRETLDQEIQRILSTGVTLTLSHRVNDVLAEKEAGGFDAVFLSIGAHLARKVDIPMTGSGCKIVDAIDLLAAVEFNEAPELGKRIIIYGGGNTAMDAARTAMRLGAEEVMLVYRRDQKHMPAHEFELEEALEEGVTAHWLRTIHHIEGTAVTVEKTTLNEQGRAQPTGQYEILEADSVVLALGQDVDLSTLDAVPGLSIEDGVLAVDKHMMTGIDGVFAGGDMVPSNRTVTIATGHGKKAARNIDAWLKAQTYEKPETPPIIHFEDLHLWYRTKADAAVQPMSALDDRINFNEIIGGLEESQARYEAARCYSCGNCFECDGCYGACPEFAISKLGRGQGYSIDYDLCTGCKACAMQCPCNAIHMINEEVRA